MNRPALDQWRIFLKCMELRNFTRTAEALDTDPAYVGKAIARLEAHLDGPLFIRTRPRLTPTWLAELYVERVSAAVHEVDRLLAEARSSGRKEGRPNGRKPL